MVEENPYQPPAHVEATVAGMAIHRILFSFKGRIARTTYWIFSLPVNVAIAVLYDRFLTLAEIRQSSLTRSALPPATPDSDAIAIPWLVAGMVLAYLPLLWMKLAVLTKRWHDQDRSANWLVVTFIPMVGMVINFLECGCNPGTRGENRYGPNPVSDPEERTLRTPVTRPRGARNRSYKEASKPSGR
ncbi:DUF805 domain-containing protein [Luteolibacter sp. Populi]|uniref:DUF805 domain-containing protein n=1 Tax=Luteolibacter sp. Populi TaxID=3230487 RepID=UPI0034654CE5